MQLRRELPHLHIVVVRAGQRERHHRHVVDRAGLHHRWRHAWRQCARVRGELLIQPDERLLFVLSDEESDDDHGATAAGGGVDVLDTGYLPQQLLDRPGDTLFDFGRRRAWHPDEHVDHRHDDLRLFFARQGDHRPHPEQQRGEHQQGGELRVREGLRQAAGRTEA